jgi:hypothetical protein
MTATFLVPAIAAALLLCAEAVTGPRRDPTWLGGVAIAAVAIAAVVMLAATVSVGRSVALTVAGAGAAVGALGLLRVLLR